MRRSTLITFWTVVSILAAFGVAPVAQAAEDYFLQIKTDPPAPPIRGESRDAAFPQAIVLTSFSWGAENPTTLGSAGGGAGTGKATLKKLTVDKPIDAASPGLFQRVVTATHDPSMTLTIRRTGANPFVYMQYCFQTVFVDSVNQSGDGDVTRETVVFAYGSVRPKYTPQTMAGLAGVLTQFGWNQVTNTEVPGSC
jgi:type VI secretion system secreted protein Hcp